MSSLLIMLQRQLLTYWQNYTGSINERLRYLYSSVLSFRNIKDITILSKSHFFRIQRYFHIIFYAPTAEYMATSQLMANNHIVFADCYSSK